MKKYIHTYLLSPFTVIALCLLVRLLLLLLGWPHTNVDESTIGEMAFNIAYHGGHPVFFYGQDYMGALQAYLAAGVFVLSGASLFAVRVAQLPLIALFLISTYLLTRLLYSRGLALFTTLLLGFGNYLTIYRETQSIGGYHDTLAFGALMLLLASWLVLTSPPPGVKVEPKLRWRRLLAFAGWGLAAGLGLWSDLLIVPSLAMSGLLLLICWREWRSFAPLALIGGLVVGALPLILFNITAAPGHDSLSTLRQIYNHGNTPLMTTLPQTLKSALLVGLPTFSNFPAVCSVQNTLFMGGHGRRALACTLLQGGWSSVVILLWLVALLLAAWTIVRGWHRRPEQEDLNVRRRMIIVALARLSILLSAGMTFALYAGSTTAIYDPYLSSRYLIAILLATPAVLYPVWNSGKLLQIQGVTEALTRGVQSARVGMLGAIACCYLLGTALVFLTVPAERAQNQQDVALVQHIMQLGARHVYSDFWTCDNIIFMSKAQVLCDTTDEHIKASGSRYPLYGQIVAADPRADYVFPIASPHAKACAALLAAQGKRYRRYEFNKYVFYQVL